MGLSGGGPIVGAQDAVSLHFKTRQPSGLLFYTGDGQDYMNLALKDGGVTLAVSLGSGRLEMNVKPPRIRFDDNQWHKVTVHRKVQEVITKLHIHEMTSESKNPTVSDLKVLP
ncbi:hypothetical protein J437_LFUL013442 [Ladona fulva]|uniref:Laminin G domain-containing protein n=1 Tax=Ladona fulva TaxID=123851 RepID=A0A8K0KJ27_LADFU|nr:hypothetical protein J437_LFUL013442 [Ladona fulva]